VKNKDLVREYDKIYKQGAYNNFFTFNSFHHSKLIIDMVESWEGKEVLEIGCGEGRLCSLISFAGAKKCEGIDYSHEAIKIAKNTYHISNVSFSCKDYKEVEKRYDVVVLDGVLEHLDKPFEELKYLIENRLTVNGVVIAALPSFLNPRGYVWMTLNKLFDVPMSLTDIHYLCPFDFEEFCLENNYNLSIKSAHQDWGAGEGTIYDFNTRLRNALKDANLDDSKVDDLLAWLRKAVRYFETSVYTGAIVVYKIEKK